MEWICVLSAEAVGGENRFESTLGGGAFGSGRDEAWGRGMGRCGMH